MKSIQQDPTPQPARQALGVSELAAALGISRATLYNAWRGGGGPKRMRIRGRVLVSREAMELWRRELESA
jgi:predicted DNA-binding transcriptional regulator AlpA